MSLSSENPKNPLHGITLAMILDNLYQIYGWEGLDERLRVNCFHSNPSMNSCLKFFRSTPWAREKLEKLYISTQKTNR
ncbi:MAG: VF530 family protein [Sulfurospirillaceae bacterium]|nr:VF530 family protein [Sulfurospirillaceae bacterium]